MVRVFNRLKQEYDFQGSKTSVRRYIREAKLRLGVSSRQACIPSDPQAGVEAEVDCGGCLAILGHLATAWAWKPASRESGPVLSPVAVFANKLIEARDEKHLGRAVKRHAAYGLLIIDELGWDLEIERKYLVIPDGIATGSCNA